MSATLEQEKKVDTEGVKAEANSPVPVQGAAQSNNDRRAAAAKAAEKAAKANDMVKTLKRQVQKQVWLSFSPAQLHSVTLEVLHGMIVDVANQLIDIADERAAEVAEFIGAELPRLVLMGEARSMMLSKHARRAMVIVDLLDGRVPPVVEPPKPKAEPRQRRQADKPIDIVDMPISRLELPRTVIDALGDIKDHPIDTIADVLEFDANVGLFTKFGEGMGNDILDAIDELKLKILKSQE